MDCLSFQQATWSIWKGTPCVMLPYYIVRDCDCFVWKLILLDLVRATLSGQLVKIMITRYYQFSCMVSTAQGSCTTVTYTELKSQKVQLWSQLQQLKSAILVTDNIKEGTGITTKVDLISHRTYKAGNYDLYFLLPPSQNKCRGLN